MTILITLIVGIAIGTAFSEQLRGVWAWAKTTETYKTVAGWFSKK